MNKLKKWIKRLTEDQSKDEGLLKLPDGSGCFVASYPLPKDHWLYKPKDLDSDVDWEDPIPFLRREEDKKLIILAAKWAIRNATNCGKIVDFDPDALVQSLVYAMTGPANTCSVERKDERP